jgi:hypothetical protein
MFLPSGDQDACILWGCVVNGSPTSIDLFDGVADAGWPDRLAGQIYYQGQIYDVRSATLAGSFDDGAPYEGQISLNIHELDESERGSNYPDVIYADNVTRTVFVNRVMVAVAGTGGTVQLGSLSYASNTAQSGTIVGFKPTGALTDVVDATTHYGIGRWRGWRRYTEANGRTLVGLDEGDDTFGTLGATMGDKEVTLTAAQSGFRGFKIFLKDLGSGIKNFFGGIPRAGLTSGSQNYLIHDSTEGTVGDYHFDALPGEIDGEPGRDATSAGLDANDPTSLIQPSLVVVWMIKL